MLNIQRIETIICFTNLANTHNINANDRMIV